MDGLRYRGSTYDTPAEGFKNYRKVQAEQGRTHSAGGTIFRSIICFLVCGVLLAIGIIATLVVYIKVPGVSLGELPSINADDIQVNNGKLSIHLPYKFSVSNPNYIGAKFRDVKLSLKYTGQGGNGDSVGGGSLDEINVNPNSNTSITFPLYINYTVTDDPSLSFLRGVATQCGIAQLSRRADSNGTIPFDYDLDLTATILTISISKTFTGSASIKCPVDHDTIQKIIGSLTGGDAGGAVQSILSGGGGGGIQSILGGLSNLGGGLSNLRRAAQTTPPRKRAQARAIPPKVTHVK